MASVEPQKQTAGGTAARFHTTHWSVVLAAREGRPQQACEALETLCRTYWFPLYAWARRQGYQPADAEDLTQGFMQQLLERDSFRQAREEKGRFRSFLLMAFRNYLTDTEREGSALKRGGGARFLPLEALEIEDRYLREGVEEISPELVYDRRWAVAVIDAVLERLQLEASAAGHGALFQQTKSSLLGKQTSPAYAEIARASGMSAGAVRVAVHRLRQRYRELFLEEIAHTVGQPEEIEQEVSYLLQVVGA